MREGVSPVVAEVIIVAVAIAAAVGAWSWLTSMQASSQAQYSANIQNIQQLPLTIESAEITTPYTWYVTLRNPNSTNVNISEITSTIKNAVGTPCARASGFIADSNTIPPGGVEKVLFYGWDNCKIPKNAEEWSVEIDGANGLKSELPITVNATTMGLLLWIPFESVYPPYDWSGNEYNVHYYDERFIGTLAETHNGELTDANTNNADGNTPPQWVVGKFGYALKFDGLDDYVEVNDIHVDTTDPDANTTVCLWFYWDPDSAKTNTWEYNWILVEWSSNYDLWYSNGIIGITTGQGEKLGTPWSEPQKWTFICATFPNNYPENNAFAKIWINGVPQHLQLYGNTPASRSVSETLDIGGSKTERYEFPGIIDEVRVYDRVLTDKEVQELYHGEDVRQGLVLYLPFKKGSGTIAYDWHNWTGNGIWLSGTESNSNKVEYVYITDSLPSTITTPYTLVARAKVYRADDALLARTTAQSDIFLGVENLRPCIHVDYNYNDGVPPLNLCINDMNVYGKECTIVGSYTPPDGPARICANCGGTTECNYISKYYYGNPDPAQNTAGANIGATGGEDAIYDTRGYIYEVRYYSRALSEKEMKCIINNPSCLTDDNNLVAMYMFREPCTTYYPDTIGETNKVCRAPPIRKDSDGRNYVEFNETWNNEFWIEGQKFHMPKTAFSIVVNTAITKDLNSSKYTMIRKQCAFLLDGWTSNIPSFNVWGDGCTFNNTGVGYNPLTVGKWYTLGGIAEVGKPVWSFQDGAVQHGVGNVTSINDSNAPLGIGNWFSEYYDGKMKNLLIFSRPLSTKELDALCKLFGTC